MMNRRCLWLIVLMVYIVFVFYLAVISRDVVKQSFICTDLFRCYLKPSGDNYKDVLVNIVGFIPVGLLTGIISQKHRVLTALLVGLLVSLAVECSQLVWKKGVFDVDDIFNNAVGALLGGIMAVVVMRPKDT